MKRMCMKIPVAGFVFNKLDSSVLSDIKITLSDSDSDTVVTEVTPDEGYDKAYKLTASNGFEKVNPG